MDGALAVHPHERRYAVVRAIGASLALVQVAALHYSEFLAGYCVDHMMTGGLDPSGESLVSSVFNYLLTHLRSVLISLAFVLPVVVAFAVVRSPAAVCALTVMVVVPFLFGLATPDQMHACDQNGCDGCLFPYLYQLTIELPVGLICLVAWVVARARESARQ